MRKVENARTTLISTTLVDSYNEIMHGKKGLYILQPTTALNSNGQINVKNPTPLSSQTYTQLHTYKHTNTNTHILT